MPTEEKTKNYTEPVFRNYKPDAADIVGFCVVIPVSIAFTLFVLLLPTIGVSNYYDFQINQQNIAHYYIAALINVIFITFVHTFSEHILLEYNVEYKHKKNDHVSYVKRLTLTASSFGSISSRMITSALYLVILIASHLQDLKIINIEDDYISQLIQINKYSFIVLTAIDKLFAELKETKSHWKYKIKKWLELFYMYRLNIMQKETLYRIEELFSKKKYKALFFEFGYVVDAITDGVDYYVFLNVAESFCDKKLFCDYYIALSNHSLITEETIESVDAVIAYIINNTPPHLHEEIKHVPCDRSDIIKTIEHIDILLRQYKYNLRMSRDSKNKKVILSVEHEAD